MDMQSTNGGAALGSSDRFGYEWARYADLLPEHEEQFLRWSSALPIAEWRGKRFLDVGCGMGRNSFWACRHGAAGGMAIDLDDATVAAARKNLASLPQIAVRQLSAYAVDVEERFDIAFSIGVIHHLESPARALAEMVRVTRSGGQVLIWVYGAERGGWLLRVLDPLRRHLFRHLPASAVHGLSLLPAAALWLVLRVAPPRLAYFDLMRRFSFAHVRSIVFDQMLPHIANYWSEAQVQLLMEEAGLRDVRLRLVNDVSWSAVGTKP